MLHCWPTTGRIAVHKRSCWLTTGIGGTAIPLDKRTCWLTTGRHRWHFGIAIRLDERTVAMLMLGTALHWMPLVGSFAYLAGETDVLAYDRPAPTQTDVLAYDRHRWHFGTAIPLDARMCWLTTGTGGTSAMFSR